MGNKENSRAVFGVLGVAGVLVLLIFAVTSLPTNTHLQPQLNIYLGIALAFFATAVWVVTITIKERGTKGDFLAVAVGLFLAACVLLALNNTSYSLNGDHGDQGLLTAQVTKFANYSGWVDFAYKGLPAFYPPMYAYILGRLAFFLGVAPYKLVKYGLAAVVFLIPFLLRKSWKPLLKSRIAILVPFVGLIYQDWYKPAEWLSLILFVPWWLTYINGEAPSKGRRERVAWFVTGGLIGAVVFQLYYYWFFIGGLSLLTSMLFERVGLEKQTKTTVRKKVWVLGITAIFSSLYWGPLLLSFLRARGIESLQNRFYSPEFAELELPFLQFSIWGLVLFIGLFYLFKTFRKNRVSFALLNLLICAYLWQLIGYLTLALGAPLLTIKARELIIYILLISALIALELGWQWLKRGAFVTKYQKLLLPGMIGIALIYFGHNTFISLAHHVLRPQAYASHYPTDLVSSVQKLTQNKDQGPTILAGTGSDLIVYTPAFEFLAWSAHFSHPAAQFHERADLLVALATTNDPACFATGVLHNRYAIIDYILLSVTDTGYQYSYFDDNFPNGTVQRALIFPSNLLQSVYFESTKGDDWVFFTPIPGTDPLEKWIDDQGAIASESDFTPFDSAQSLADCLAALDKHIEFEGKAELAIRLSELLR